MRIRRWYRITTTTAIICCMLLVSTFAQQETSSALRQISINHSFPTCIASGEDLTAALVIFDSELAANENNRLLVKAGNTIIFDEQVQRTGLTSASHLIETSFSTDTELSIEYQGPNQEVLKTETVLIHTLHVPTVELTHVTCRGDQNGSISIQSSPGASYSWSSGDKTSAISDLSPGAYSVTVEHESGCPQEFEYTINDVAKTQIDFRKLTIKCNGREESLLISSIDKTADFSFDWSDDGRGDWDDDKLIILETDGSYSLDVKDSTGCIRSESIDTKTLQAISFEATPVNLYSTEKVNESWFVFDLEKALNPAFGDLDNDGLDGSVFEISYHNSFIEAELGINELNAEYYSEPTVIFARMQSRFSCFDIAEVTLLAATPTEVSLNLKQTEICQQESAIVLSGGTPEGGVYRMADCLTDNSCPYNAISYDEASGEYRFDPAIGEGVYAIQYSVLDVLGNEQIATDEIAVQAIIFDFFPQTSTVCLGSQPIEISTVPNGQAISGPGITSQVHDINNEQIEVYYFDPSILETGIYNINSSYVFNSNTRDYSCEELKFKSIAIVDIPIVSIIPSKTELCSGEDFSATCTIVNGGENPSYHWYGPNGFESKEQHIALDSASADFSGTFYLEVENGLGCVVQESVDIQIRKKMEIDVVEIKSISCAGDANGSAKVIITNPISSYSYEWANGNKRARANKLAAGMHEVTVTDDLGCIASGSVGLFEPEKLQAEIQIDENITCHGESNAKATLLSTGGTGAHRIEWSTGDVTPDVSQLTKGAYTVTVTDENACQFDQDIRIEEPDELVIEVMLIEHLTCFADENGRAEIMIAGGNPPYNIDWSNGEKTMSPSALVAGENKVLVKDSLGCSTAKIVRIDGPAATIVTVKEIEAQLCGAAPSGRAVLEITGPSSYNIEWDNGESGETAIQLSDGIHTATISDINGCELVQEVTIALVTNMLCQSEELAPASCQNAADGMASARVSNGAMITSYTWDNGEQTQVATGLTPGIHEVTVTDENNCEIVCSVTIGIAAPIQIACNNVVNLSLAGNCQLNFKPDLVVENFTRDFEYTLSLTDESGNPVDTFAIKDYVGQTLDYVITETCKLSSCWGAIKLEDKLGPQLNCTTQTIDCIVHMNSLTPSSLPVYETEDFWYNDLGELEAKLPTDCSVIKMTYSDDMLEKDCDNPFSHIIQRTWHAKDEYNNESTCIQQINIYREEHTVVWPYDTTYVYCMTDDVNTETVEELKPDHFGWPTLYGMDSIQAQHPSPCMTLDYVFSDQVIKLCSGSYKVLREWVAIQACNGSRESYTQTIHLNAIKFDVVQRDTIVHIETGFDCNTDMYLPIKAPSFCGKVDTYAARIYGEIDMEDCKVYTEKPISSALELTDDGKLIIPDLEIGCNFIEVYLTTDCYETDTLSFYTTVVDYQVPVLVCDAQTVVSLGSDGRGHLTVNNVDNGSWDNCGIEKITLVKQDSICAVDSLDRASDIVSFCCEEAGQTVIIIMEATDYSHNKSTCTVEVFVEDGVMPYVECPENVFLPCTEDIYDFDLTGKPWADIKCSPVEFYHIDSTEIGQCRNELVDRHWYTVFGRDSSFLCTQTIQLYNEFAITEDNITWPEDVEIEQCSANLSEQMLGEPLVDTLGGCELIATNFIDREFETSLGSCLSILREWTIIDWCQYNENDEGIWKSSQVIKIHDKVNPTIDCQDVQVCALDRYCEGELKMSFDAADDCSTLDELVFHYEIDLSGDGQMDNQVFDQHDTFIMNLPLGNHALTIYTTDQCGNTSHCVSQVVVEDCKAPTPYCIAETVSTLFNEDDVVEVWATDFNLASRDNCTDDDDLSFSFQKDTLVQVVHFRCEDIAANASERFDLSIWVSDDAGNQDACQVTIRIDQRESSPCDSIDFGSSLVLSGMVTDVNGERLNDFSVFIENSNDPDNAIDMDGENGQFEMNNAQKDNDYEIALTKPDDFNAGITTVDMITLQNHLLGVSVIENEHKLIAADVNRDGRLSSADLILMKRMIIGQISTFPEYETPWVFKLLNQADVMQISDTKFITEELYENVHMDLVAIKLGDIDGSAELFQQDAEAREFSMEEGDKPYSLEATIYPNPIQRNASLSLHIMQDRQPVDLSILANDGRLLWNETKSFSTGEHSIDLSLHFENEQAGLYYVIVHQAGQMKTMKVVKL